MLQSSDNEMERTKLSPSLLLFNTSGPILVGKGELVEIECCWLMQRVRVRGSSRAGRARKKQRFDYAIRGTVFSFHTNAVTLDVVDGGTRCVGGGEQPPAASRGIPHARLGRLPLNGTHLPRHRLQSSRKGCDRKKVRILSTSIGGAKAASHISTTFVTLFKRWCRVGGVGGAAG
jgi:hypothetical protein